jgi:hypothetical protein
LIAAVALTAAIVAADAEASPRPASIVEINAEARAEGNRRPAAVKLGIALLARTWPAQVTKVRVDGYGSHEVAGLVLSGVKFHGRLDAAGFAAEVASLIERSFAASDVEEVDVWATVPLDVAHGQVVAGDFAQPTARIVFSVTVPRSQAKDAARRLRTSEGVYWAPDWKAQLGRP